jgi:hypothetical protein
MAQKGQPQGKTRDSEAGRQKAKEIEKEESLRNTTRQRSPVLTREQREVYQEALRLLETSGIDYAVGAAFARHIYTSIWRNTKDLDVFLKPQDLRTALDVFEQAGFQIEIKDRSWLAKAWKKDQFIDLIFGTGHGQLPIDDRSFAGVKWEKVLGVETNLIPIEEMAASAMFIAGRNRFDGGEVVHLIRSTKGKLDWARILERLAANRQLLLWHLVLFDYIYPGHAAYLPQELMAELFEEMRGRWQSEKRKNSRAFRGTILDPYSYTVDVKDWGYEDRRTNVALVTKEGKVIE